MDSPAILGAFCRAMLFNAAKRDPKEHAEETMLNVAYACRYGFQRADDVMDWGRTKLHMFSNAIETIVEMEAKAMKAK